MTPFDYILYPSLITCHICILENFVGFDWCPLIILILIKQINSEHTNFKNTLYVESPLDPTY